MEGAAPPALVPPPPCHQSPFGVIFAPPGASGDPGKEAFWLKYYGPHWLMHSTVAQAELDFRRLFKHPTREEVDARGFGHGSSFEPDRFNQVLRDNLAALNVAPEELNLGLMTDKQLASTVAQGLALLQARMGRSAQQPGGALDCTRQGEGGASRGGKGLVRLWTRDELRERQMVLDQRQKRSADKAYSESVCQLFEDMLAHGGRGRSSLAQTEHLARTLANGPDKVAIVAEGGEVKVVIRSGKAKVGSGRRKMPVHTGVGRRHKKRKDDLRLRREENRCDVPYDFAVQQPLAPVKSQRTLKGF